MRRVFYIASGLVCSLVALGAGRADEKPGSVDKGKEVYSRCSGCHDPNSTERRRGPGLKGLFSKDRMQNGKKPTEETILDQINEGSSRMPGFRDVLSEPDKKDLIAYLKTL
jgi:cytochrome c